MKAPKSPKKTPKQQHQQKKTKKQQQNGHGKEPLDKSDEEKTPNGDEASSGDADGSLEQFDLPEAVRQRLQERGITRLFPVQQQSFQHVMSNRDLIVQSRTGTGKTLAFGLPLVLQLLKQQAKRTEKGVSTKRSPGRAPRVLVLAPTRELAKQIADDFEAICPPDSGLSILAVYGGVPYEKHRTALAAGVDVVVGAPGRVLDLAEQGCLRMNRIRRVVLDEVDRMLDMGFRDSVDQLLRKLYSGGASADGEEATAGQGENQRSRPQTLLFSATLPPWVEETSAKYLDPKNQVRLDLVHTCAT